MKLTLSLTSKLNGIRGFSLPPIHTCPGRTVECQKYCYGLKSRFKFQDKIDAYAANFQISKRASFVDVMLSHLSKNERYFRIHTIGDFYSQSYLHKWIDIAEEADWINFMAYTRNYRLEFSERPENLKIFYTVDATTRCLPADRLPLAIIVPYRFKKYQHRLWYDRPPVRGIVCNSNNCLECRYCWFWDGMNVLFPQKYKKWDSNLDVSETLKRLIIIKEGLTWLLEE